MHLDALTICYYLLQYFAPILNTNPATEAFWKLFPDQKYLLYANYIVVLVASLLLLAYIPAIMSFNRVKSNWWGFVTWTTMIGLAGVFIGLYETVRQLVLLSPIHTIMLANGLVKTVYLNFSAGFLLDPYGGVISRSLHNIYLIFISVAMLRNKRVHATLGWIGIISSVAAVIAYDPINSMLNILYWIGNVSFLVWLFWLGRTMLQDKTMRVN